MTIDKLRTALKAYAQGYKIAVKLIDDGDPDGLNYQVLLYLSVDAELGSYLVVNGVFNPGGDTSIKNFMSVLVSIMEFRTQQMYEDS
jgi:hypothetical protein